MDVVPLQKALQQYLYPSAERTGLVEIETLEERCFLHHASA
jgi:hypothetical protein